MKNEKNEVSVSAGTDEIYSSTNPVIRWLGDRLIVAIKSLLTKINAGALSGLNVGCGEGQMIARLSKDGVIRSMVAMDIDPVRIAYARRHHPVCEYVRADIFHLPFQSKAFAYVIATEILEHLSDPGAALREIARVAKPGAQVLLSVPHEPFFHWGNIIRGKHWRHWGCTPSHVQFWSRPEFRSLIGNYIEIQEERWLSCFPWQLYLGKLIPTQSE